MKSRKVLAILVLVFASMANGSQYLTVNNQNVDSITLEAGKSCTIEVVSDNSDSYVDYVGFEDGKVLGAFSHQETTKNAGDSASVKEYNKPSFYGYSINAAGISTAPSPGIHFVFEYEAQEVGYTRVTLYDSNALLIDFVHITVIPAPMGTAITYQGRLVDSNSPANGLYDFEFKLYCVPNGGIQEGNTIDINDLDVIDGYFTAELDFGSSVFNGDTRWLGIGVRPGDSNDAFITLSPRQEVKPTPYTLYAENAATDNDWMISGNDMYSIPSGKIGIGTTNPARRLVVNEGGLDVYAGSSGEEITFSTERFLMTNSNEDIIIEAGKAPSDYVAFSNAGSEVMAVKNGGVAVGGAYTFSTPPSDGLIVKGSVGFGTNSPKAKLEVNGENQEAGLRVAWGSNYPDLYGDFKHTGSGGLKINANANGPWADISLQTDRMTRLFIESGGNVGIGTTTPSEKLDVRGNINVSSNHIKNYYGFPRPNYDSGWVSINHGEKITLNHNIGGNVDNYVVDLQRKEYTTTHGINNFGIGVNYFYETSFGVNWQQLTTDSITVWLHSDDGFGEQIRIRIWVYN